jgi:hypothetical protein
MVYNRENKKNFSDIVNVTNVKCEQNYTPMMKHCDLLQKVKAMFGKNHAN